MSINKGVAALVGVGVAGVLAGLALAGSGGVASGSAVPTLPIPGTQSSIAGAVRSVHGYAYWSADGPDLYPEVARQVDCLVTAHALAARMVVSINRPDPLVVRFSYRPAHGATLSAPAAARTRKVAGMREYVATLARTPGVASAQYPRGPRERCWVTLSHSVPSRLPGRPAS